MQGEDSKTHSNSQSPKTLPANEEILSLVNQLVTDFENRTKNPTPILLSPKQIWLVGSFAILSSTLLFQNVLGTIELSINFVLHLLPTLMTWTLCAYSSRVDSRLSQPLIYSVIIFSAASTLVTALASLKGFNFQFDHLSLLEAGMSLGIGFLTLLTLTFSSSQNLPSKSEVWIKIILSWQIISAGMTSPIFYKYHFLFLVIASLFSKKFFQLSVLTKEKNLLTHTDLFPTRSRARGLKRIQKGEVIPRLMNMELKKHAGKKVWLIFYRYAGCPLCLHHLAEIIAGQSELKRKNIDVIAVFQSQTQELQKLKDQVKGLDIEIISDPEEYDYRTVGAEKSWFRFFHPLAALSFAKAVFNGQRQGKVTGDLSQLPAHFLLNTENKVEIAYYGKHIGDQLGVSEALGN